MTRNPEALRSFMEGLETFRQYVRTSSGEDLKRAASAFDDALRTDPSFLPARFHKAVVLTHERKHSEAIQLLEELSNLGLPFQAEISHQLAFALAKTYQLPAILRATEELDRAEVAAKRRKRNDLILLVQAARVYIHAILGGQRAGQPQDLEDRARTFLPMAIREGEELLRDRRLRRLDHATLEAALVEVHNGLGIAYMRMGRNIHLFNMNRQDLWDKAKHHFSICLSYQPSDHAVLQNLGTLRLIQGHALLKQGQDREAMEHYRIARDFFSRSVRVNPYDQFPHYRLSQIAALFREWDQAKASLVEARRQRGAVSQEAFAILEHALETRDSSGLLET